MTFLFHDHEVNGGSQVEHSDSTTEARTQCPFLSIFQMHNVITVILRIILMWMLPKKVCNAVSLQLQP